MHKPELLQFITDDELRNELAHRKQSSKGDRESLVQRIIDGNKWGWQQEICMAEITEQRDQGIDKPSTSDAIQMSFTGIGVQSGSGSLGDSQRQENAPAASTPFVLRVANEAFEEYLVRMICSANAAAIAYSQQNSSMHAVEVVSTPNLIETIPIFAAKVVQNPIEFTMAMERVADLQDGARNSQCQWQLCGQKEKP